MIAHFLHKYYMFASLSAIRIVFCQQNVGAKRNLIFKIIKCEIDESSVIFLGLSIHEVDEAEQYVAFMLFMLRISHEYLRANSVESANFQWIS